MTEIDGCDVFIIATVIGNGEIGDVWMTFIECRNCMNDLFPLNDGRIRNDEVFKGV